VCGGGIDQVRERGKCKTPRRIGSEREEADAPFTGMG